MKRLFFFILPFLFYTTYSQKVTIANAAADTANAIGFYLQAKSNLQNYPDSVIYYSTLGIKLSKNSHFQRGLALNLNTLGLGYFSKALYAEALAAFEEAISINKKSKDYTLLAKNYNNQGLVYQKLGNYKEAIRSMEETLALRIQLGDSSAIAESFNNIGVVYTEQGNYVEAILHYYKFLDIKEKINDSLEIAKAYNNISNVMRLQKNYAQALEYAIKALQIRLRIKDQLGIIQSYNNIGSIKADAGNLETAITYYQKSVDEALKIDSKFDLALAYSNLGQANSLLKRFTPAKIFLTKAIQINETINARLGMSIAYNQLAELFVKSDSLTQAKIYAEKSLEIATRDKLKVQIKDAAKTLYDIYKKGNETAKSLYYLELHSTLKDSLLNVDDIYANNQVQLNYIVDGRQKEILLLKKQNELKDKENSLQRFYLLASLIFGIGTLCFLLYYFRELRIKNVLNRTLTTMNEEVQAQKIKIEAQTVRLKELNEKKNKIISVMSHDVKSPIASLQMLLDLAEKNDISGAELQSMIKEINVSVSSIGLLLENILGWSKTQIQSTTELEKANLDIHAITSEVIQLYRPTAANKNITLTNDTPIGLTVHTNKDYILLILRNLVSNAIKFTPNGGTVTVGLQEKGNGVEIAITDTGVGMNDQEIDNLFNTKNLYTKLGTSNEKGTGLGLLFVKESIEKCGGKLAIRSQKGQGSEFVIQLDQPPLSINKNRVPTRMD